MGTPDETLVTLQNAVAELARRVRHLESLERGTSAAVADLPYVLGDNAYTALLTNEIPVPRYAYHPDMLPAAAHADSDEFEGVVLDAGWVRTAGTATATLPGNSHLIIAEVAGGASTWRRVGMTQPPTPWRVTTRISAMGVYPDSTIAALGVWDAVTGYSYLWQIKCAGGAMYALVGKWTNVGYSSTVWVTTIFPALLTYLRIYDDGTDVHFSYSIDGGYNFCEVGSEGRLAWLANGMCEIGYYTEAGAKPVTLTSDWIRVEEL